MSLFGALNLGSSALNAQQAALQVTGNNIANVGNANYSRETADLAPNGDQQIQPGIFMGTGVALQDIQRQVDESLNSRLRSANSDASSASASQTWLSQVESSFNALSTSNISTQMSTFFGDWSTLANSPQSAGQRQVVVSDGANLASSLNQENSQLTTIQTSVQQQIAADVKTANGLAQQLASLNGQITTSSSGPAGSDNALLDQRDSLLTKLSSLMNVNTVIQSDGSANVYVGSTPLVVATTTSGVGVQTQTVNGAPTSVVVATSDDGPYTLSSGELGALQNVQTQVNGVIAQTNTLAHNIIGAVNALHASGQGLTGVTSVTGNNAVADANVALDSTAARLDFPPTNGSFVVHVTNTATGLSTSSLVQVNLTGSPNDTTLNSLATSLNAVAGVGAKVVNGQLTISATNPGSTLSFSQDSSSVLAGLGINTIFTGSSAEDIAVNQAVQNNPSLVAAAQNGDPGDNQTALAIAALNTQAIASTGGVSLQQSYQNLVDGVSTQVANATSQSQAAAAVKDTLTTQQQALSGVSIDEESVNMLTEQRAYQGAAIFITTVNSMMTSLLAMIP